MAQICASYLRNKIMKQKNKGLKSRAPCSSEGDEYGFLPLRENNGRRRVGEGGVPPNKADSLKAKITNPSQHDKENLPHDTKTITSPCHKDTADTLTTSSCTSSPLYYSLETPLIKPCVNNRNQKHYSSSKKECKRSLFTDNSRTDLETYCRNLGLCGVKAIIPSATDTTTTKWSKPLALKRMGSKDNCKSNLLNLNYPKTTQEVEGALLCATESRPANVLMVALRTHSPTVPDSNELYLAKGTIVCGLFKTRKWICIRLPSHRIGYVPVDCLDPIGVKKCKDFSQQFPTWITLDDKPVFEKVIEHQHQTEEGRSVKKNNNEPDGATVDESIYVEADEVCSSHIYSCMNKLGGGQLNATDSGIGEDVDSSKVLYIVCYKDKKQDMPISVEKKEALTPLLCTERVIVYPNSEGQAQGVNNDSVVLKKPRHTTTSELTATDQDNGYESSAGECGSAYDLQPPLSDISMSPDSGRESTDQEQSVCTSPLPSDPVQTSCNQYKHICDEAQTGSHCNRQYSTLHISGSRNIQNYIPPKNTSYNRNQLDCNPAETSHNLTVLFDYNRKDRHDISIKKAEVVLLIHDKHKDWLWVRNHHGGEGYIPKNYVVNLEKLNLDPHTKTTYC